MDWPEVVRAAPAPRNPPEGVTFRGPFNDDLVGEYECQ